MATPLRVALQLLTAAILVAGVVSLISMLLRADGPRAEDQVAAAGPEHSGDPGAAEILAARYAPVYFLKDQSSECDQRGEAYAPLPVDAVIGGIPTVELNANGAVIRAPSGTDLENLGRDAYLDLPGDPRRAGCSYARLQRSLSDGFAPTIYARIAREEGKPGFVLQFWSFWLFNDWNNTHEGDWELVQLRFEAATPEDALEAGPVSAAYAQHGLGERRLWDDGEVRKEGTRPSVYVAAGSHASYFRPGVYVGLGRPGRGVGCDTATGPHRRVDPGVVLVPTDPTGIPGSEWLTFRGSWGERVHSEFAGPRGPITKRAWGSPVSWADDLTTDSRRLASVDPLGQDSISTLCSLVSDGAWLARRIVGSPLLLGLALPVAAAGAGTTAFVVARHPVDVRRGPRRVPGFLRQRRSFFQVLWTAALIYRERPWLFLGIALGFLPLQVLFGIGQAQLAAAVLPGGGAWPLPSNFASRWAGELAIIGLHSVLAYVFVLGGTLAAVASLDRGERATVISAYRRSLRRAPHLLVARAATLATILLLSVSLVGIPLALWFVVRWFFIEEAVVVDGVPCWQAPRKSTDATAAGRVRAAIFAVLIGGAGIAAGMVIAGVLLLYTPLDPWQVNAVAGLAHLAVLPFCALALSLAYGDLRQRRLERGA